MAPHPETRKKIPKPDTKLMLSLNKSDTFAT